MSRMKIAVVAAADLSIRFLLLEQIQALQGDGHEVIAVCGPGRWVDDVRQRGVRVQVMDMARELSPWRDVRCLLGLARFFRQQKFDVVHTHTPKAGLLGPVAARMAGVPVVVHTIHGLLFHDRMPKWRRRLFWLPEKFTATFSHLLLSQSREDMDVAVRSGLCREKKLRYIGNGINVQRFSPSAPAAKGDGVVIGAVGRLVYEKGFAELFQAAEALATRHPEYRFLVVGPEEHAQNDAVPVATVEQLTRKGTVRFTGWADDMHQWYAAMDVFALPSHREGIPRACMEAAAMGLPVIASDIRGCREVVQHGKTGVLVPVRDAAALAGAIERLAGDPALRAEMGRQGREHVIANFSEGAVLQRLRSIYAEIEAGLGRKAAHA